MKDKPSLAAMALGAVVAIIAAPIVYAVLTSPPVRAGRRARLERAINRRRS